MTNKMNMHFAVFFLFFAANAHAADWNGTVIGISDGDTVTVLNDQKNPIKIRLTEIDAPEKAQALYSAPIILCGRTSLYPVT